MCGIAGVLNLDKSLYINRFKKMSDVIKHRGPDDEGFYFYNEDQEIFAFGNDTLAEIKEELGYSIDNIVDSNYNLALAHRRLSIIDTSSKGHQPMCSSNIVITYNGEIYNYIEIREELKREGYYFKTEGDTEVLINAYLHWGEECVKQFNGMWSFAIWDKAKKLLFCSRDRLGEKPFYYYKDNEKIVFGSEIKQLFEYGLEPRVNEKTLFTFLFYGIHDHSDETFFENVFTLQGGYNMIIQLEENTSTLSINKYKYWDLDNRINNITTSFERSAESIGNQLEKSISLRLRSDVEVGSCLSGGLDSSSVVSIATNQLKKQGYNVSNFNTFTACYDDSKEVDERYYSDMIVKESGCSNFKVKPSEKKLKEDFEKLVWHQEEPFGSLSIFAGWCVMERVKTNNVKVLLDGQGGDETLLGYERFYAYHLKTMLSKFEFKRFAKEFALSSKNSRLTLKDLFGYFIYFNNKNIRKKRLTYKTSKFLNSNFSAQYKTQNIVDDMLEFKSIEEVQKNELARAIGHLLRYEDRNSMAHSIEARVPFLDHTFVETAASIPNKYKLKDGWTKAVLRKYMEDKMPKEVTYRKNKLGFSVPQKKWLDELNDYFKETLLDNPRSTKYFNIDYVREIFDKKTNHDFRFKFIVVETWMRVFDVKG
ncbi:asparagine synthase (glutamine-hydrolyzing) [Fusibacter tunisiensis]|uniref:asparagine synthase (glutamine-hydrolyzing) n=1 Tax=Fusibacter tunisiensis TaxID=1008308 RepID=A0ABS2MNB1_9FIRM|nr:asparagine synthase (glutamine-hydrolyzing) [Fusibacter tunisiensis]MBM7560888.1 asparagine synthase (glutamine-hydrolyzing) [Fusibacter tunisiensis]